MIARHQLVVLWAGRHQRRLWEELCSSFRGRLERHYEVRDQRVKARAASDDETRRRAEAAALVAALPDPSWAIALDPRGRMLSSEELAAELGRLAEEWPHPVAFLIGSDLGLGEEALERARLRLSFGPMTFGHELARLILYEQLYRAMAIRRGIKYHRPRF